MARKKLNQVYATTNSAAGRNGNYAVSLDFSKGTRGTVQVTKQPERTTFTEKSLKRSVKK